MTKKLNDQGFGAIEAIIIVIILGLVITTGWLVYKKHSQTIDKAPGLSKSITVFGEMLPRASCDKAKALIKEELFGDICYIGKFSVDGEEISYISVAQSESYRAQSDKNCSIDCGGSIAIPGHDSIVRANGAVEYASTDWTNQAEPYIDYLTGCGTGKFSQLDSLQTQGKFVKINGKIAIAVSFNDANLTDDYGNQCKVGANLVRYTSNQGQLITIKRLEVHYQLQDISSCEQQTKPEDCYATQAAMRNDLQLCDKAFDKQYPGSGADYCIEGMAKRRLDTTLCDKLNDSRDTCRKDTQELKNIFAGKLAVN